MAIDKDPSVYRDRGMIGSSDELDEYGVWVKSEPEDIGTAPASPIEEPTLPDIEDLPDLELDSTESFDFPPAEAGSPEEENELSEDTVSAVPKTERAKLDFSVAESGEIAGESLPSFEDIASFEAEMPPVSNEDFTELSMDDFLEGDEGTVTGPSDLGTEESALDIDLDFKDSGVAPQSQTSEEDFDFQVEDEGAPAPSGSAAGFALETVSDFDDFLNDLSDTEKASSEPAEVPAEAAVATEEQPEAGIAESEDIAFDVEESEPVATTFEAVEESEEIVISEMEGDTEKAEMGVTEETEESFDDVAALSRDLAENESPEAPAADAGLSTQLLMRIADELSSIKTELSSLKEELAVLRGEVKPAQTEGQAAPASHGFFDEEDDEKIALTGDELDNILNTADFTEEAGADATAELSDEAIIDDFLMDREDLLGTTEETAPIETGTEEAFAAEEESAEDESAEVPTIDDITFEEEPAAIERITLEEQSSELVPDELQQLQMTGVSPMTPPPEDTSYLEADDLATADIDLREAVIDEPDLGGPILEENPVVEPSIDHIDLDMEEPLHIENEDSQPQGGDGFENIELTLDEFIGEEESGAQEAEIEFEEIEATGPAEEAPVIEESFAEVVPEGFVVEPEGAAEAEAEPAEAFETVELTEESEESQPLPVDIRHEVKAVLSYMDQLLESLPEEKIEEFAKSEYFDTYKKLFEELGLV